MMNIIKPMVGFSPRVQAPQSVAPKFAASSAVVYADDNTFDAEVKTGADVTGPNAKAVLVDVFADWCGPCKYIAPLIDDLADQNPDIKVVKVRAQANRGADLTPKTSRALGINAFPTLLLFNQGQQVAKFHLGEVLKPLGAIPQNKMNDVLVKALAHLTKETQNGQIQSKADFPASLARLKATL